MHALSLKQPWAALLVSGLKTVEVRRWSTSQRGRILIHAARRPDERPEAWKHVPEEWLSVAQLNGGIVGAATLLTCFSYADKEQFARDDVRHLNDPSWFQFGLMGFVFDQAELLPFHPCPGWMRFFPVTLPEPPPATDVPQ